MVQLDATLTMNVSTQFTTTVDGVSYNFVTTSSTTIAPTDGVYTFSNLKIKEEFIM